MAMDGRKPLFCFSDEFSLAFPVIRGILHLEHSFGPKHPGLLGFGMNIGNKASKRSDAKMPRCSVDRPLLSRAGRLAFYSILPPAYKGAPDQRAWLVAPYIASWWPRLAALVDRIDSAVKSSTLLREHPRSTFQFRVKSCNVLISANEAVHAVPFGRRLRMTK